MSDKSSSKKKPPTPEQMRECEALNRIFLLKKNDLDLSQGKLAAEFGASPAAISHYLGGVNALNLPVAVFLSRKLRCALSDFSPRLAREARLFVEAIEEVLRDSPGKDEAQGAKSISLIGVSQRSSAALDRITFELASGRLTDDDAVLLEQIASRLAANENHASATDYAGLKNAFREEK